VTGELLHRASNLAYTVSQKNNILHFWS